jgi:hypothetical protein
LLKRLDEATRAARECREGGGGAERAQLERSLGALRQKLRIKDEVGAVIENKHSRLAEVYRALEAECRAELETCRHGAAASGAAGRGEGGVEGDGRGGLGAWGGGLLLLGAVAGYLSTCLLPPPVLLARRLQRRITGQGRRTVDIDGWALPSTNVDCMKLS